MDGDAGGSGEFGLPLQIRHSRRAVRILAPHTIGSGDSLSAGPVAGTLVRSQPIHAGGATFVAAGTSVGYALAGLRSGGGMIPVFVDPH